MLIALRKAIYLYNLREYFQRGNENILNNYIHDFKFEINENKRNHLL